MRTKGTMIRITEITKIIAIISAIVIVGMMMVVMPSLAAATTAYAQLQQPQQQVGQEVFESEDDGFRLQIPQGWVIEDHDNERDSADPNIENLAMLCLENEALPGIGGEHNCQAANYSGAVFISRWPDLQSMPEFQNESSSSNETTTTTTIIPTTNDLVALWVQYMQSTNQTSDIQIVNTTDVDEFRKIVNMTFTFHDNAGTFLPFDDVTYGARSLLMFVLSEGKNTGYIILPNNNQKQQHLPAVQQVFDSFQIVE